MKTARQKILWLFANEHIRADELAEVLGIGTHHLNQVAKGNRELGQKNVKKLDALIAELTGNQEKTR